MWDLNDTEMKCELKSVRPVYIMKKNKRGETVLVRNPEVNLTKTEIASEKFHKFVSQIQLQNEQTHPM